MGVTQQLQAPFRQQAASALRTAGVALMVVALYLVLENSSAATGALGGLTKGLVWLRDPGKSINYAH